MAIQNASLTQIYDRLHGVSGYHPMSAETFYDWSVEAGDAVTVSRDNVAYTSPVSSMKLVWRGSPQVTLNAAGKQERDSVTKTSQRKYGRGGTAMQMNQGVYKDLYSDDGRLHSQLMFTESKLEIEFQAGIESTRVDFASALEYTASHLEVEFAAGIESTRVDFTSQLELTASHLETEFAAGIESTRTDFASQLEMTASALTVAFTAGIESTRTDFQSELEMTASSLNVAIADSASQLQSNIDVQAGRISLVVTDGSNPTIRAAQIAVAINRDGSNAYINADHIHLTGETTLDGQLTVQDGSLLVKTALLVSGTTGGNVSINNGKITAKSHQVNSGGDIIFVGTGTGEHYDIDVNVLKGMIKSFSVNTQTNTLTLVPFYGDPVNFSKAISTTLTGSWSSAHLDVLASPQNQHYHQYIIDSATKEDIDGNPAATGAKSWYVPVNYKNNPSETGMGNPTGLRIAVNATSLYNAGWNNAYGQCVIPTAQSLTSETLNCAWPSSSVDGSALPINYTINVTQTSAQIRYGTTVVAMKAHTQYADGQASVTLNDPTWTTAPSASITGNSNTATVTTNGRPTQLSKTVPIYMTQGNWSSNKKYVYAHVTNSSDSNRIARLEVDASTLVTNAGYSGRASVTLLDPTWTAAPNANITVSNNTATVSTTGRTDTSGATANLSKTVPIYMSQGDWSSNKKYVYAHVTNTNAGNRITRIQVDASTLVTNAGYAGRAAVTLNNPTWSTTPGSSVSVGNNTVSVKTSGRTNTAGTADEQTKSVVLYLNQDSSFDSSYKKYVYITHTDTSASHRVARIQIDASNIANDRWNSGYDTAKGYVSCPSSAASGGSITIKGPNAARTASENYRTYTLNNNGNNEVILYTVVNSSNVTVAKITHNKWNSGYDTAKGYVSCPTAAGTGSSITIKGPNAARTASENYRTYALANNGNNEVVLYTSVNGSNVNVAKFTHNKYNAGWGAAVDKTTIPLSANWTTSMVVKYPTSTVGTGNQVTYVMTPSAWNGNVITMMVKAGDISGTTVMAHDINITDKVAASIDMAGGYNAQDYNYWWSPEESGWYMNPNMVAKNSNGTAVLTYRVPAMRVQNFANAIVAQGWDGYRADVNWGFLEDTGEVYRPAAWGVGGAETWFNVTDYGYTKSSYSHSMTITRVPAGYTDNKEYVYYGKLYYWDEFNARYVAAYSSNQYWYRSGTNKSGSTTVHY